MINKIKSAIGGLAMLAASAMGESSVTNASSYVANVPVVSTSSDVSIDKISLPIILGLSVQAPTFSSIGFISSNNVNQVELKGNLYEGDFSSYRVQLCSNLVENVWQDSTLNTNVLSRTGKGREFIVAEQRIAPAMNYRLRQN